MQAVCVVVVREGGALSLDAHRGRSRWGQRAAHGPQEFFQGSSRLFGVGLLLRETSTRPASSDDIPSPTLPTTTPSKKIHLRGHHRIRKQQPRTDTRRPPRRPQCRLPSSTSRTSPRYAIDAGLAARGSADTGAIGAHRPRHGHFQGRHPLVRDTPAHHRRLEQRLTRSQRLHPPDPLPRYGPAPARTGRRRHACLLGLQDTRGASPGRPSSGKEAPHALEGAARGRTRD